MKNLLDRVAAGEVLICDGAMGTMLFARGVPSGACLESVNLSNPELLEEIAAAYLDAGADILETNTFGGSPLKLAHYGLDGRTEEINRRAVAAVRKVARDQAYVCASCGSSGSILAPYGDTDPQAVYDSYLRQVRALIDEGIDALCVETMTDLNEARLALQAARAVSSTIPILATMTFEATRRGFRTIMGTTILEAAQELEKAGANLVGSNCGNGIDNMIRIAHEFRECTAAKLIIQSNAGLPEMVGGVVTYRESPEFMAQKAQELVALGVSIIGGCCGTTPAHIAALRRFVAPSTGS